MYINLGDFSRAMHYLNTGLRISQKFNQLKNIADIIGNIGLIKYFMGLYKEAMDLFKEELKINRKLRNSFEVQMVSGKIANAYLEMNDYDKAILYFEIQKKLCLKLKNKKFLSYAYGGLAHAYLSMYDFEKAFYYLNNQILLCEEINERRGLSAAFSNTGLAYFRKQDYDLSMSYFYRALENDRQLGNIRGLVYIYSSLGNVCKSKKEPANALRFFKKELELCTRLKMHRQEASAIGDIGLIYKLRKKFEPALKAFNKQTYICRKYDLPQALFHALDNMGEIYREMKKFDLSLKYFKDQLALSKKEFGSHHPNTSVAYRNLGNAFLSSGNCKNALSMYQRSLIANSKNFTSGLVNNAPPTEEAYSGQEMFETLVAKAFALRKFSATNRNSLTNLKLALSTYELALSLTNRIRTGFREENSKYFMTENLLNVYEDAIEAAVEIYDRTRDRKYLEHAFHLSERNKAAVLIENIRDSEAKITANLPEKLVERERSLKAKIAFTESEKHKELQKGRRYSKSAVNHLDKTLFNLKREYNAFIEKLEKKYPEYYALKSKSPDVSIEEIRKKLITADNIIIEYFAGERNIYIFKITDKDISVNKVLKKKSFDKSVKDLRESLVSNSLVNFSVNRKKFSVSSYRLYVTLLGNVLNDTASKSGLIIIPDNTIGYIPFEALITAETEEDSGYKDFSYLIKNFTVSYGYSSVYLMKNITVQKKINQKKIIGFAPDFEDSEDQISIRSNGEENVSGLAPLNYNAFELKEIEKYFPGDYFIKKSATKDEFLKSADRYSIIHLATHCLIDEKNPMFSKICFSRSPDPETGNYLHSHELFNLKLNSRLAVLSACHTGFGKLIRGEGILSIARGFAFSNCNSIIMSLWQVNDRSTSKIMVDFYKELFHGNRIDASLRSAKLSYIENSNQYNSSPFFWAPFILIGNSDAVNFAPASN